MNLHRAPRAAWGAGGYDVRMIIMVGRGLRPRRVQSSSLCRLYIEKMARQGKRSHDSRMAASFSSFRIHGELGEKPERAFHPGFCVALSVADMYPATLSSP